MSLPGLFLMHIRSLLYLDRECYRLTCRMLHTSVLTSSMPPNPVSKARIPATSGIFFRNELISFISNHLMFLLSINHVQDFFQSAVPFLAALVGIIVFALFLHFLG